MFNFIKRMFHINVYTEADLSLLVVKGRITEVEKQQIIQSKGEIK